MTFLQSHVKDHDDRPSENKQQAQILQEIFEAIVTNYANIRNHIIPNR